MTLSMPVPSRRTVGLAVTTLGFMLAWSSTGYALTPVEIMGDRIVNVFLYLGPAIATVAFIIGGTMLAMGMHDAYHRVINICIGVAVILGCLSLVAWARP